MTTVTPVDLSECSCYLDTQEKGMKMMHEASCRGVGRVGDDVCRKGSLCARRYAAESLQKDFVFKLKMAMEERGKGEE